MRLLLIILCGIFAFRANYAQEYSSVGADYISSYQKYISPYKNGHCSHYLHCSEYAMKVFEERPFAEALVLTSERLIRCGYDKSMYETTYASGSKAVLDFPPYMEYPSGLAFRERIYPHVDIKKEKKPTALGFIDMLINQSDYQSALLEMDRQTYYQQVALPETFTRRLKCYLGLNQLDKGIYYYEKVIVPSTHKQPDTQLQAGLLYYKTEQYDKTLSALSVDSLEQICDSDYVSKINAIKGVASFCSDVPNLAQQYFDLTYQYNPEAQFQYNRNMEILKLWRSFKPKNPATASILSIIPGLGYWYTGHKGSAISALLFDAVFGYAAYTSFSRKNYGAGILFSVLSTSFYIGNIKGAGTSAKRYNRIKKKQIQEELENNNQIFISY